MIFKALADMLNKDIKKIDTIIGGRKFSQGMWAAATAGVITGILIIHKSRKKIREDTKNITSNAVITIEVHDLDRLIIESLD